MNVPLDPDGRLRLTVVSPFGELGGGEIWLLRLLDATTSLDVSVILLRDGPLAAACTERGIPVAVLQVGARPQDLARSWLPLRRRLREQRPDVILANGIKAEAAVGPVARSLRIPHVWVKHDHSFDRRLTPILARVACSVIITAEELAPATRRSDVITIHPPMPPYAPYAAADARARIDALAGASSLSTLAMLTRLTPYKGVDAAIQALAGAPGWRLVVFGETIRSNRERPFDSTSWRRHWGWLIGSRWPVSCPMPRSCSRVLMRWPCSLVRPGRELPAGRDSA